MSYQGKGEQSCHWYHENYVWREVKEADRERLTTTSRVWAKVMGYEYSKEVAKVTQRNIDYSINRSKTQLKHELNFLGKG